MSHLLPLPWVDSLFAQLGVKYGRAFLAQYVGYELEHVKADWARELGGLFKEVDGHYDAPAITWALDNLVPGRAPTAMEFRAICRRYDPPQARAIGYEPKRGVDPRFKEAIKRLAEPLDDKRPDKVRAASNFIARWGCEGIRLSPLKKQWLEHSRRVMRDWEAHEARAAQENGEPTHAP